MILIVHFGAQYAQLIARAVRELGVEARVLAAGAVSEASLVGLSGVILSGGPRSVDEPSLACARSMLEPGVPVLGICYGHQLLAAVHGGAVTTQHSHEYGSAILRLRERCRLTQDLTHSEYEVWMSHGDSVTALPTEAGWHSIGTTGQGSHAVIAHEARSLYGVQFHPEVTQTTCGPKILENFVMHICHSPRDFQPGNLLESTQQLIREQVGSTGHILVACSLGVDSTTVAVLCQRALGAERVHPVFVDNGLMRQEDLDLAREAPSFLPGFEVVEAADQFLEALEGVADPQEKRRITGQKFWEVFHAAADRLGQTFPIVAFTQGTIAPDVIESGKESGAAAVIKTHHNLVPTHDDFPFLPFEPLRSLYKDQVRKLGELAGAPLHVLGRHPFPGPGLAIRARGAITRERIRVARHVDAIFIGMLRQRRLYDTISQAFAALCQDMSVCVRGDTRVCAWDVVLRAVYTRDFMTAKVADLFLSFLKEVDREITNRVPEVACVDFRLTPKPPATIECE